MFTPKLSKVNKLFTQLKYIEMFKNDAQYRDAEPEPELHILLVAGTGAGATETFCLEPESEL